MPSDLLVVPSEQLENSRTPTLERCVSDRDSEPSAQIACLFCEVFHWMNHRFDEWANSGCIVSRV